MHTHTHTRIHIYTLTFAQHTHMHITLWTRTHSTHYSHSIHTYCYQYLYCLFYSPFSCEHPFNTQLTLSFFYLFLPPSLSVIVPRSIILTLITHTFIHCSHISLFFESPLSLHPCLSLSLTAFLSHNWICHSGLLSWFIFCQFFPNH